MLRYFRRVVILAPTRVYTALIYSCGRLFVSKPVKGLSTMKMYSNGDWTSGISEMDVVNPYTGKPFDAVPSATLDDVEKAIDSAGRGVIAMRGL
ncbi:uncharacterized protein METZ01_LOCUS454197, partial [marine metagenome]